MEIGLYLQAAKNQHYIASMRPLLNKRALFSDMTQDYVSPFQPKKGDVVSIRFRTAKNNVDSVFVVICGERKLMRLGDSDALFDYYECAIEVHETINYYFEVQVGNLSCFYNIRGVTKELQEYYNFRIIPGFSTPDWAKGAVMYQIYVDRFYNGDPSNDVQTREYMYLGDYSQQVEDWSKYPAQMGVREFYGGDLQGVIDKMDYLADLGIDVIYFNPLFVSPSNHKYDIQDYDYIDPHIGRIVEESGELLADESRENRYATRYINRVTNKKNLEASNALFAELVENAHKRGIRVILDGVFNHCGSFNKWLDRERIYENAEGYEKGAFVDANSPYHDFFRFYEQDKWPYNYTYDGWWGHDTLPKLNYEGSQELMQYILNVAKKWVSPPYNVDGWRLDVAADLGHSAEFNHHFWQEFRSAVKEANPEAVILAEHYGNTAEWLKGNEWDTVMNYDAFMEPITWFLTGMQKHSDDYRDDLYGNAESFWGAMVHYGSSFSEPSLLTSMNELSNHDHSRFLTRTNKKVGRINTMGSKAAEEGVNKAVFREAVVMQMTWPGAPTIYYGDEAGVCGFTDPDNRRTYPWGNEDTELIRFHKEMIALHKERKEILTGSLKRLSEDYNYLAYGRFNRNAQTLILVNNNNYEITKVVRVWELGVPRDGILVRRMFTYADGFDATMQAYDVEAGKLTITLPPTSAMVLVCMGERKQPEETEEPEYTDSKVTEEKKEEEVATEVATESASEVATESATEPTPEKTSPEKKGFFRFLR